MDSLRSEYDYVKDFKIEWERKRLDTVSDKHDWRFVLFQLRNAVAVHSKNHHHHQPTLPCDDAMVGA